MIAPTDSLGTKILAMATMKERKTMTNTFASSRISTGANSQPMVHRCSPFEKLEIAFGKINQRQTDGITVRSMCAM